MLIWPQNSKYFIYTTWGLAKNQISKHPARPNQKRVLNQCFIKRYCFKSACGPLNLESADMSQIFNNLTYKSDQLLRCTILQFLQLDYQTSDQLSLENDLNQELNEDNIFFKVAFLFRLPILLLAITALPLNLDLSKRETWCTSTVPTSFWNRNLLSQWIHAE